MTPAMGIGVLILLTVQKHSPRLQKGNNLCISLQYMLSGKIFRVGQIHSIAANRIVNFQVIALADDKIILAMGRGCMHGAGTGLRGDMISENNRNLSIKKTVLQQQVFQGRTFATSQYLNCIQTKTRCAGLCQCLSHY